MQIAEQLSDGGSIEDSPVPIKNLKSSMLNYDSSAALSYNDDEKNGRDHRRGNITISKVQPALGARNYSVDGLAPFLSKSRYSSLSHERSSSIKVKQS